MAPATKASCLIRQIVSHGQEIDKEVLGLTGATDWESIKEEQPKNLRRFVKSW